MIEGFLKIYDIRRRILKNPAGSKISGPYSGNGIELLKPLSEAGSDAIHICFIRTFLGKEQAGILF